MKQHEFNEIYKGHALWLKTDGLKGDQAYLKSMDLRGLYIRDINLESVNLENANLRGVDLRDTNLSGAYLRGADLRGSILVDANLSFVNLQGSNLSGAKMYASNLLGADLRGADLRGAILCRTNLRGAHLSDSNLAGANLQSTNGNKEHVKAIFCGVYDVAYTSEVLQIGCENHSIDDWMGFDDARIIEMEGKKALRWWREWKPIIKQIIAASPATPTQI